jgi:hypothetical protein
MGLLNLSDADMKGFEAIDAGRYNAEVFEITMDATKGGANAKMPANTPMMKIQFKITDEGFENRRVWTQFVIPPKDYDKVKAQKMKGMIARFFIAMGTPEETVLGKDFDPDFQDYIGLPCVCVVGKEPKKDRDTGDVIEGEYNNPVKGVKPAGSIAGAATSGLL